MAEFEIKVPELETGGKQYDFPITPSWLDSVFRPELLAPGDLPLRGDPSREGKLSIIAEQTGEDVVVRGTLRARLLTECSRCLSDAPIDVDVEVGALFTHETPERRPLPGEEDLTPDELDAELFTGERVVLDQLVREHLLLEVPMQPLCREDCAGLEVPESVRGPADLSGDAPVVAGKKIDPRLAPLLDILQKGVDVPSETKPTQTKKSKGSR